MEDIVLIGGGGHCKSAIDVIEQEAKYNIAGIVDNTKILGSEIFNYKVIGNDYDLSNLSKKYKNALITLGQIKSANQRIKLYELAEQAGFSLPTIISPYSYVSKHSSIGSGTIVMHGVVINADVKVGVNCIINSKSLVEHDCNISDHCHISTSVTLNGGTQIEQKCFIGSKSVAKENSHIRFESILSFGALIR
jgi:sugar O-acyltransferase (sialic acid O-acetyltransferase NeuD family)